MRGETTHVEKGGPAERVAVWLARTGAVLHGHFHLTSGRHSDTFLQCSQLLQHPRYAAAVGRAIAERFSGLGITTVVGPAMGGVILAHETARALRARAIYAEKEAGEMVFRRGFILSPGEVCLVVEDAVTTGGSVQKVMAAVERAGGRVRGVGAIVDRSGGRAQFWVDFHALVTMDVSSWEPAECPLCAAGVPLVFPKSAS